MGGEDDKIIRIPGETLSIKVSPEEEAYRKKYLPDAKKLTDEKLVCTVCSVSLAQNIHKGKDIYVHRALQVLVCEACYNFYGDGSFSVDEDGDDKYCRWCGQGGTLYICAACNCAFCQKCTKQNLKASVLAELENDDWKCYICNPRPLFGCRTICWGAQQLNAVGKEKEAERLKKIKERLEKLEAKKKEANERKSRKNSSSEDEALTKKRKRSSDGDSSSPEVMPKRKKREARASRNLNGSIGRRKKDVTSGSESEEEKKTTRRSRTSNIKEKVQSSSEDESDNKSKKDKTKKKKKRRDDSDDSSDTSKKKSKRKSVKKTTDDDSSEEEEKIRKKKNKKKAKKKKETSSDSSSESSSERHRKKNKKTPKKRLENSSDSSDEDESSKSHKKTKRKPDKDGSLKKQENVDSDNEPKKGKRVTTDSEDVPVNTNSAEDILVKKRIKLAILWLTTIVKDISELGTLISLRATNFSKKKINTENLKSYEDVLNCVSKIKQLISGVHSNYVHIEKTLDSHLKPWKILTGLEDAENEKTIGSESSVSNDRNVSKADNKDRGINGTPEESKEKNNKEDNMNNWSDDSEEQNETRALISKANEALDKSQIEDEQSETIKEDHKDEKSETAKTDNEEESNVVGDVKIEKEATKSSKIDSVKPDSESKLQSPKKSPLKDKKDAVPDNKSEERSPKKSSSVKKNSNEDKCDEKSKEDKEEPCKEEMETEGDKENTSLHSDREEEDHVQDSSEEDSQLQSFNLKLKDKWQSGNSTEDMNLKQSLELDSSNQSDTGSSKSAQDSVLDEKQGRIPKIVLKKLNSQEFEKEKNSSNSKKDKSAIKENSQTKPEGKKNKKDEAEGLSNEKKDESKNASKRKVDQPASKHKTKDEKSNCLTSSDEEDEKQKKSKSKNENKSNNSKSKKIVNRKNREENEPVGDSSEEENKSKNKEKKLKDKDSSGKRSEKQKKQEEESDNEENNKSTSKKSEEENKLKNNKKKSKDKDSSGKRSEKQKKQEEESDNEGNNKSRSKKSEEENKLKNKEKKSKDRDSSGKRSEKQKKQEEESDNEGNNKSRSKKNQESKPSRKSKGKDYDSDEKEVSKSKKSKTSEENNKNDSMETEKNAVSSVGLDSSDDEKVDTAVVVNGAESGAESPTGYSQEKTETSHAEEQEEINNGVDCDNMSFTLELQASSTENTNDFNMVQVKDEKDKDSEKKFVGLDSSSEEEIKAKKKDKPPTPKKRQVRNKKKPRNVLVLSSDDEEMEKEDEPTQVVSSDEENGKEEKDEDFTLVVESSAESSGSEIISKNKRKKKGSSDSDASISGEDNKKKKKRRRVKCADSSEESGESGDEKLDISQKNVDGESPAKGGRKNIKKIKKKGDLEQTTIEAAEEEKERRRRIEERQKLFNQVFEIKESAKLEKLVLDFDPESKKELISVDKDLVTKMKPHQAKGVKFMWDSCFESVKQIKKTKGSGCILAHCMGLGKTFQVISLVHTLLTHEELTKVRTVMVVCPLSTVLNWVNEFGKWLEDIEGADEIEVFHLTKYIKNPDRARELRRWQHNGGVLVMGYEMFRNLTNESTKKFKAKLKKDFLETLIDPGADLIVCDEGHMLKNEATALSKAMTRVKTLRRIVLTGTPMQNNLKEYHCMVQFVKPNLLGTSKEFLNRFVNPINNGQFVDSTDHDVKLMKRRAHVLHKMLEGLVQRFDYNVLTPFLPPKQEYVISVCLSELQEKLYSYYLENESQKAEGMKGGTRLFMDWQTLGRVWTHPRVLKLSTDKANWLKEKKAMEASDSEGSLRDFIDDDSDKSTTSEESSDEGSSDERGKKRTAHKSRSTRSTRQSSNVALLESSDEEKGKDGEEGEEDSSNKGEWWSSFIEPHHFEDMRQSGKLMLLFAILKECEMIEDKVLVFSQSLFSLDLIEYFLDKIDCATQEGRMDESLDNHQGTWSKGLDYFRLDGSTSSENRNIWCKAFNREDNPRARLFLISTRAGGLGINLTAANRVIIFDASWNPSHDIQSIFRIYRFGQKKPCYVYRFVAHGTMEEKVYERQVAKQSISNRVVDEQQVHRHFSMNDLTELYTFTPASKLEERPTPALPRDPLMAEILSTMKTWIEKYHEHDSLLENVVEEELNEEERKAAWEDYENDKKRGFMPPAGPQGPSMNPNAAWNQQIEIMRQQLKLRYANKSDDEINQILVYQVSLLMRQQQQQQMQMAAQMQAAAANNMNYRPQMFANNMMGGFNMRPQMQTTAHLRNIAPKPSSQQANYTPDQIYRMQQQANLARLQMQKAQAQQQQQKTSLLGAQLAGNKYPTANLGAALNARTAAEMLRMTQNYQAARQAKPGVTITEITDDKPQGSSES